MGVGKEIIDGYLHMTLYAEHHSSCKQVCYVRPSIAYSNPKWMEFSHKMPLPGEPGDWREEPCPYLGDGQCEISARYRWAWYHVRFPLCQWHYHRHNGFGNTAKSKMVCEVIAKHFNSAIVDRSYIRRNDEVFGNHSYNEFEILTRGNYGNREGKFILKHILRESKKHRKPTQRMIETKKRCMEAEWLVEELGRQLRNAEQRMSDILDSKPAEFKTQPPDCIASIHGLREFCGWVPHNTGVYFLCDDDSVIYVGKSDSDVLRRVSSHVGYKTFSRFFWVPTLPHETTRVEDYWITKLQPPFNLTTSTRHRPPTKQIVVQGASRC